MAEPTQDRHGWLLVGAVVLILALVVAGVGVAGWWSMNDYQRARILHLIHS